MFNNQGNLDYHPALLLLHASLAGPLAPGICPWYMSIPVSWNVGIFCDGHSYIIFYITGDSSYKTKNYFIFYTLSPLLLGESQSTFGSRQSRDLTCQRSNKSGPSASISLITIINSSICLESRDCNQIWLRIQYRNGLTLKSF